MNSTLEYTDNSNIIFYHNVFITALATCSITLTFKYIYDFVEKYDFDPYGLRDLMNDHDDRK
jgi:hypothetical protein